MRNLQRGAAAQRANLACTNELQQKPQAVINVLLIDARLVEPQHESSHNLLQDLELMIGSSCQERDRKKSIRATLRVNHGVLDEVSRLQLRIPVCQNTRPAPRQPETASASRYTEKQRQNVYTPET